MLVMRRWATRNARSLEIFYWGFARLYHGLDRLWGWIGLARLERPFAFVEAVSKGFLFDCRMCGDCVLSRTGMTCPMNCPKRLRNGPCGGVRADGHCEALPKMSCVWVEAWAGAQRMRRGLPVGQPLPPCDRTLEGSSAWLRLSAENLARRAAKRDRRAAP